MGMDDKQKKIVAATVAGAAVLGGIALYCYRKNAGAGEQDDQDFAVPAKVLEEPRPAAVTKGAAPVSAPVATMKKVSATEAKAAASMENAVSYKELFCTVRPSKGWECANDPAPMPNIAMVSFKKPEFEAAQEASQTPGAVPAVILTIEDISGEHLTLLEMKDKSKQMAFQQMAAMTQGAFRPQVVFEEKLQVGDFEYCLEYNQSIPPYLDMRVNNLFCVKNGLAYVFQFLAAPSVYSTYKADFLEMARNVVIHEDQSARAKDYTKGPHVLNKLGNGVSVLTDPSWTVEEGSGSLLRITTTSQTKAEQVLVYAEGEAPAQEGFNEASSETVNGVVVQVLKKDTKERKVATGNGFTAVVSPLNVSTVQMQSEKLVTLLKSMTMSPGMPASKTFINNTDGYQFPISSTGSFICSKIGGGTTIYVPGGIQAMHAGMEAPTVTIRIGHPDTDPSCAGSLAEWRQRLLQEDESITKIEDTKVCGVPAITFMTKEMQEVGPGQRSEVQSKVVIAMRDGITTLFRWEAPSGVWRKFERHLDEVLSEFGFI